MPKPYSSACVPLNRYWNYLLLLIPGNALIHALTGATDVNAVLPITGAVILVLLSMILTLIGGWIPSKKAARKDPVTALRTE